MKSLKNKILTEKTTRLVSIHPDTNDYIWFKLTDYTANRLMILIKDEILSLI